MFAIWPLHTMTAWSVKYTDKPRLTVIVMKVSADTDIDHLCWSTWTWASAYLIKLCTAIIFKIRACCLCRLTPNRKLEWRAEWLHGFANTSCQLAVEHYSKYCCRNSLRKEHSMLTVKRNCSYLSLVGGFDDQIDQQRTDLVKLVHLAKSRSCVFQSICSEVLK